MLACCRYANLCATVQRTAYVSTDWRRCEKKSIRITASERKFKTMHKPHNEICLIWLLFVDVISTSAIDSKIYLNMQISWQTEFLFIYFMFWLIFAAPDHFGKLQDRNLSNVYKLYFLSFKNSGHKHAGRRQVLTMVEGIVWIFLGIV